VPLLFQRWWFGFSLVRRVTSVSVFFCMLWRDVGTGWCVDMSSRQSEVREGKETDQAAKGAPRFRGS
jgi:hypothetical protein